MSDEDPAEHGESGGESGAVGPSAVSPELRHLRSEATAFRRTADGDSLVPLLPVGKVRLRALDESDRPLAGARLRLSVVEDGEEVSSKVVTAGPTGYATADFQVPASENTTVEVTPVTDGASEAVETLEVTPGEETGAEVVRLGEDAATGIPGVTDLGHGGLLRPPDSLDVELAPELFNPTVTEQDGTCVLDFEASVETRQFRFNQLVRKGSPGLTNPGRSSIGEPIPFDHEPERLGEGHVLNQAAGPTLGKLNVFEQTWTRVGHSIGRLLHSLALAPCEETNVAIIEWSREERGRRGERATASEQLQHELHRDRLIEESVDGAVEEVQRGSSSTRQAGGGLTAGAGSITKGEVSKAIAGGLASVGKAVAGSLGISIGGSAAESSSFSEGHREVTLQTMQNLQDSVVQRSSYLKSERSMVVTQSQQAEGENIRTRTVRNRNRNHAMTVEYFQVLEHYNVETELADQIDVLLVPYEVPQFLWDETPEFTQFRPLWVRLRAALADLGQEAASEFDFQPAFELPIDWGMFDLGLEGPELARALVESVDRAVEEVIHRDSVENRDVDTLLEKIPRVAAGNFEERTPMGVARLRGDLETTVENVLPPRSALPTEGVDSDLIEWLDTYADDLSELLPPQHRDGLESLYRLVHTPEVYENDVPVATTSNWTVELDQGWEPAVSIVLHTRDGQEVRLTQTSSRERAAISKFRSPPVDITAVESVEVRYRVEQAKLNALRAVAEELGVSLERVEDVIEGEEQPPMMTAIVHDMFEEQMQSKREFDLERLRIVGHTDPSEYISGSRSYAVMDVSDVGATLDGSDATWSRETTQSVDIDFDLTETRRYQDYSEVEALLSHIKDNKLPYLRALWLREDADRRALRLEPYDHDYYPEDGPSRSVPLLQLIENRPVGVMGNAVAFPLQVQGQALTEGDADPTVDLSLEETRADGRLVSLPTRGVYAETLLSKCNATEVRDVDRMVDPRTACETEAPDITGVAPGSRATDVDLEPSDLAESTLGIQRPPRAPAPRGTTEALALLAAGGVFRDMSLGSETVEAAQRLANRALGESGAAQRATLEALSTVLANAEGRAGSAGDAETLAAAREQVELASRRAQDRANEAYRHSSPTRLRDIGEVIRGTDMREEKKDQAMEQLHGVARDGASVEEAQAVRRGRDEGEWRDRFAEVRTWPTGIVDQARAEENEWKTSGGKKTEDQMESRLFKYYDTLADAGLITRQQATQHAREASNNDRAWSAAYVSHVVREGGVPPGHGFWFSYRHIHYVTGALLNRKNDSVFRTPFWLYDPTEIDPRPGDLLCKNRGGNTFDLAELEDRFLTETTRDGETTYELGRPLDKVRGKSHVDVVVDAGQSGGTKYLETLGGNTYDNVTDGYHTVGRKRWVPFGDAWKMVDEAGNDLPTSVWDEDEDGVFGFIRVMDRELLRRMPGGVRA